MSRKDFGVRWRWSHGHEFESWGFTAAGASKIVDSAKSSPKAFDPCPVAVLTPGEERE